MSLLNFFKDKFDSDPYSIMDAAYHDISNIAAQAGIDWSAVSDRIRLSESRGHQEKYSTYNKQPPKALEKKLKGRVEVYSRVETTNDGIRYPFINFVQKGFDAGSWSGLQFLFSEYSKTKHSTETTVSLSNDHKKKQALKRAQRLERERLAKIEEEKIKQENKEKYDQFLKKYNDSELENGTFGYVVKKQISSIFNICEVKKINWDHGPSCIAIPLSRINSPKIVGWQRIYENGDKKLTSAITTGDYSGSCFVIGSLNKAKKIILSEGFATAATCYLAAKGKFDASIMCISANNLINVVNQVTEQYPWLDIIVALDNDYLSAKKGKGNTGIRCGIEILKKYPKVKCVYPKFDDFKDEDCCSDFNDLWVKKGKTSVIKQISAQNNKLNIQGDSLKAELMHLLVTPTEKRNIFVRQLYACCDVGMTKCPIDYSPKELIFLINKYLEKLKVRDIYEGTVKSRVLKQFIKAGNKAQSTRTFSDRITNPTLRPEHITYQRFKKTSIDKEIFDHIKQLNGPVIVRAGMGSGKSKHLLRPLMLDSASGISLAHRISLTSGLYDMMTNGNRNKSDIFNYQDSGVAEISPGVKKLILCVNSIIKGSWTNLIKDHGFLGFDEATQGLRAICTSKIVKFPVDVFNRLILTIASSQEHAVLVDADANDTLIELCEMAMKKREEIGLRPWSQIHVIELNVDVSYQDENGNKKDREVFYTDSDRVFAEVLESAKRNEKFILATDNKGKADQILYELKQHYPDKKFIYVSQDTTPNPDVIEFTDAPNKMATKYDGLIYSPAISSGVSIETKHFQKHYGIFCGVIVPSDAIQMMRRDRTATEFMIGIDKMNHQRAETAEDIRKGFIQAMIQTGEINQEFCDAELNGDKLSLGLADTPFTKMKMKIMEMESVSRSNFANNLIHILHADGYKVHHLAENKEQSSYGKELRKEAKKSVYDLDMMRYLETKTPDEKTRNILLEKRSLTEEEKAMLVRFDIENELGVDVNEDTLNFWLSGGKNKIKLVEIRNLSNEDAAMIDREEQAFLFNYTYKKNDRTDYMNVTALSQKEADEIFKKRHPDVEYYTVKNRPAVDVTSRTYAALHKKLLNKYFSDCGIDLNTGKGEVTTEAMQTAMDNLIDIGRIEMFNNVIRFGGYSSAKSKPKRADTVFRAICKANGYKVEKRRLTRSQGRKYVWFITKESWDFILNITEQRKDMNKTVASKQNQVLDTGKGVILDNISIYNNKNNIEDQNKEQKWIDMITLAIDKLPIPLEWAVDCITTAEKEYFIDCDLPINLLTNTLIGLYLTDNLGYISPVDLDLLQKGRMVA